jgi:uncharacterized protein
MAIAGASGTSDVLFAIGRVAVVAIAVIALALLAVRVRASLSLRRGSLVRACFLLGHTGPMPSTPRLGVPAERISVTTSDSLELAAWYAPSRNGAAAVVYPGPARASEARMLIRHGYGALLLEPRGEGASQGDPIRWAQDRDLLAGAAYLRTRPDVDPHRIGGFGFSVGGESLLEATPGPARSARSSRRARAAASETRISQASRHCSARRPGHDDGRDDGVLHRRPAACDRRPHRPHRTTAGPPYLRRPGMGDENTRQPRYYAAAGRPKALWRVAGAGHTGGIDAQPEEYEKRVIAFLDRSLPGAS